jgi:cystathionine beta-lyase/cystathionine gamma-synthase
MFRERERERERSPNVQAGMKKATERNEARKFYATACGMKAGSQPRMSVCKDRDNNLTGND